MRRPKGNGMEALVGVLAIIIPFLILLTVKIGVTKSNEEKWPTVRLEFSSFQDLGKILRILGKSGRWPESQVFDARKTKKLKQGVVQITIVPPCKDPRFRCVSHAFRINTQRKEQLDHLRQFLLVMFPLANSNGKRESRR